jgi:hypothetical protein
MGEIDGGGVREWVERRHVRRALAWIGCFLRRHSGRKRGKGGNTPLDRMRMEEFVGRVMGKGGTARSSLISCNHGRESS